MKTQCPHCYAKFNSRDEHKGKKVKCPKCNQAFVIGPLAKVTRAESCSRCGREIGEFEQAHVFDGKIICAECNQKLRKVEDDSTIEQAPSTKDDTVQRFSNAQPLWHLILLSIATLRIYEIYWFYKTWKGIKKYTTASFSPGRRTFGLFIPIYGLVLIDGVFRHDVELLRTAVAGPKLIKRPLLFGASYVLSPLLSFLGGLAPLPHFFPLFPLAAFQRCLNQYWEIGQPELPRRTKFSAGEIALLVIGVLCWIVLPIVIILLAPWNK